MPNNTTTRITITGKLKDIEKCLHEISNDEAVMDFSLIIPMPKILGMTVSGMKEFHGVKHESWHKDDRPFTPDEQAELDALGFNNWYDWCCESWGTKWNAYSHTPVEVTKGKRGSNAKAQFSFYTAWSFPTPIATKLVETYPSLKFQFEWHDEGCEGDMTEIKVYSDR